MTNITAWAVHDAMLPISTPGNPANRHREMPRRTSASPTAYRRCPSLGLDVNNIQTQTISLLIPSNPSSADRFRATASVPHFYKQLDYDLPYLLFIAHTRMKRVKEARNTLLIGKIDK
jgi:hypothetical protein